MFSERFNAVCKLANLSSHDVAEICGVDVKEVRSWKKGLKSPTVMHLEKFCMKARVDLQWLVFGS